MTIDQYVQYAQITSSICVVITATIAVLVFNYTRRVNRRRATLDMVMKTFLDPDGRERYKEFKALLKRDQDGSDEFSILDFSEPSLDFSPERSILNAQLNEYELIALGIRRGVFDEALYKMWFQGQFIKDFENVRALIDKIQKNRPSVYCEFKNLYLRWKKSPHPENRPQRVKLIWWAITRNESRLAAYSIKD